MYTRDLAGTRYSPLKQIDTGNVAKVTEAWSYKLVGATPVIGGLDGEEGGPERQLRLRQRFAAVV